MYIFERKGNKKILLLITFTSIIFLLQFHSVYASQADSLFKALKKAHKPEDKISIHLNLGNFYVDSKPEESRKFALAGISLSKKENKLKFLTSLWATIGSSYYYEGNLEKCLAAYQNSLKYALQFKNKDEIARAYNNLGLVYLSLSNYENAQKNFYKSLNIREELKDIDGEVAVLNNLSQLQTAMENYPKAEYYCEQAYKKAVASGNKSRIAIGVVNFGVLYYNQENYPKSLEYFMKAIELYKELGDKWSLAGNYSNAGEVLARLQRYEEAMVQINKSLEIKKEIGDKTGVANAFFNLGSLYSEKKQHNKAIHYFSEAEKYYTEYRDIENLETLYKSFAEAYSAMNNHEKAYLYFSKYDAIRDTLLNENRTRTIEEMQTKYETEKKEKEIQIHQRDLKIQKESLKAKQAELDSEKYFKNFMIALVMFALIMAVILYLGYNNKRKANRIISLQKHEVEQQRDEVHRQKLMVEHKNKEILDSINYAKRIQDALLANEQFLMQYVPDHMVYFKPKDIVSGDFYWTTYKDDFIYLAACDSTGHGVPGAFMSLLNTSFLNEAVNEMEIRDTGSTFDFVRKRLVESISREGAQDGMDAVLLRFNAREISHSAYQCQLEYSAANNAPVLIRDNTITTLPYDKMPVGKSEIKSLFTKNRLELKKGDVIFIYTDGFADQFGGPKGKKFKVTNLNKLLLELCQKHIDEPMTALYQEIDTVFNQWKGDLEQVDDVCIIGIRI